MTFLALIVIIAAVLLTMSALRTRRDRRALEERRNADLEAVRRVADEDVTRFGEELQRLDSDLLTERLDEATMPMTRIVSSVVPARIFPAFRKTKSARRDWTMLWRSVSSWRSMSRRSRRR